MSGEPYVRAGSEDGRGDEIIRYRTCCTIDKRIILAFLGAGSVEKLFQEQGVR